MFLYGANDGHNMVVPFDAANYAKYSVGRSSLAWTQPELTQLTPITPLPGGLQLSLPTTPLAPLATLFDQQKCAIVATSAR